MRVVVLLLLLFFSASAHAVQPDEIMKDPVLEARARDISKELRCLVCQGEAIDESDAELAKDLRLLVRERLRAGDTDEEVVEYLRERYGDYVMFRPPLNAKTFLLWFMPFIVLMVGVVIVRRVSTSAKTGSG